MIVPSLAHVHRSVTARQTKHEENHRMSAVIGTTPTRPWQLSTADVPRWSHSGLQISPQNLCNVKIAARRPIFNDGFLALMSPSRKRFLAPLVPTEGAEKHAHHYACTLRNSSSRRMSTSPVYALRIRPLICGRVYSKRAAARLSRSWWRVWCAAAPAIRIRRVKT